MRKPLGGGEPRRLDVCVGRNQRRVTVAARCNLYGVPGIGVVGSPAEFAGMFVIYNADREAWQIVASVFHAFRQTWHILWKYGRDLSLSEKSKMREAARLSRQLNLAALGLVPNSTIRDVRREVRSATRTASELLGQPRKPTKIAALEQLRAIAAGADRRGRPNPAALRARSVAARDAILNRLEREILQIDPNIKRRQHMFINLIQMAMLTVATSQDFLDLLTSAVGQRQLGHSRERVRVAQHCRYLADDLERLDFVPFRATCLETARDLRQLTDLVGAFQEGGSLDPCIDLANRCRRALALKQLQIRIERLIFIMTRAQEGAQAHAYVRWCTEARSVIADVSTIDDADFRRRVCTAAISHLEQAVGHLSIGNVEALALARDYLKRASSII